VRAQVRLTPRGYVLFDDTVLDKNSSCAIELVRRLCAAMKPQKGLCQTDRKPKSTCAPVPRSRPLESPAHPLAATPRPRRCPRAQRSAAPGVGHALLCPSLDGRGRRLVRRRCTC
jgi:hypothetical protein